MDQDNVEEQIVSLLKRYQAQNKSDLFLFSGEITRRSGNEFLQILSAKKAKAGNAALILTTFGGDPHAAFRMMRAFQAEYKKITVYVFGPCISAGTLMTLVAHHVVVGYFGELSPLDMQVARADELSTTSSLNLFQALEYCGRRAFEMLEQDFIQLKVKSGDSITTKTAMDVAAQIAIGMLSPITEKIDPVNLGETERHLTIAYEYGKRLCMNNELVRKLVYGYPAHTFVIDFREALELFGDRVRRPDELESEIEETFLKLVRNEQEKPLVIDLLAFDEVPSPSTDNNNPKEAENERSQRTPEGVDAEPTEDSDINRSDSNRKRGSRKRVRHTQVENNGSDKEDGSDAVTDN